MARFRLKQAAYLKPHPQSPVPLLLEEGDEVDLPEAPGPYVDPLDEQAAKLLAAYHEARPGATMDPTRRLPGGVDPIAGQPFEQQVMTELRRREVDSAASASATDSKIDRLTDLVGGLVAALQQALAPPHGAKGRA